MIIKNDTELMEGYQEWNRSGTAIEEPVELAQEAFIAGARWAAEKTEGYGDDVIADVIREVIDEGID